MTFLQRFASEIRLAYSLTQARRGDNPELLLKASLMLSAKMQISELRRLVVD
jgi:hypothetical protein